MQLFAVKVFLELVKQMGLLKKRNGKTRAHGRRSTRARCTYVDDFPVVKECRRGTPPVSQQGNANGVKGFRDPMTKCLLKIRINIMV